MSSKQYHNCLTCSFLSSKNGTSNFFDQCILHINILLTLIITFVILLLGKKIAKKIGATGIRIIQRIMGLILMVISIQFIINGIIPIINTHF